MGAVAALTLAAKTHDLEADPVTRALLMADLGVLWTPSAALYDFYARGIWAEYAHVADTAYVTGRAIVLGKLRDQLAKYLPASEFRVLKRNLSGEVAALEQGKFDLTT